ncbi:IucA/IucC family protein [Yinghuangia soli]|uniref:IucA/IucC family siderophore biosynthesis protein n=1 Tax=Yinghuangia soli TaxID=2908204 RepID=A0AA41U6E7_9ACTN|nr:IucA/IucC family protein [Yinghuangia soli]MCF2530909.1 IucA/IucC family siderophore biosynthesis protein [Yinghuangia soli]
MRAEPAPAGEAAASGVDEATEAALCMRILDALLREDVHRFRTAGRLDRRRDGWWLTVDSGYRSAEFPVRESTFLGRLAARGPHLNFADRPHDPDGRGTGRLETLLEFLAAGADPADADGFAAFAAECRAALATVRSQEASRAGVFARLAGQPARGHSGALVYDTLAAHHDHPAYPTGRCRTGLTDHQLAAHAPEFHPAFAMRWAAVPRAALFRTGTFPEFWPQPSTLGLPGGYDDTHIAIPVHPLTDPRALTAAMPWLRPAPEAYLDVAPTLSMRSVAVLGDPGVQLKVPLDTSTLGLRNRRTMKPGSLVDGDAGGRLLRRVLDAEPQFAGRILIADEHTYGHARHELVAFLVRRLPPGLDDARVVTVAALAAAAPGGRTVVEALADEYFDGDPVAFYDSYLRLLLDWHVTLWMRYGIALEAHQQNTSVVLDRDASGATRLRLLLKDNDGPRLIAARVQAALDGPPLRFDDARIPVTDGRPLADLFTTITLHLCAAAPLFGLAAAGRADAADLMELLRDRLVEAAAPHAGTEDYALLRDGVLDAELLPVKLMVTAGTLLDKQRSGAADINKHYARTGPNYLRPRRHADVRA